MYEYYAEVEEAENQIALYEYGRTDVTYNEAKYLQKMYDVKEILKLYDEYTGFKWIAYRIRENEGKEKSKRLEDFSLAILKWQDEYTLGIRWNLTMREDKDPEKQSGQKQCKGMPFSSAHPIWFVLPKQLHESVLIAMKSFLQDADLEQIRKKLNIIL